jgi:hypothetical protein
MFSSLTCSICHGRTVLPFMHLKQISVRSSLLCPTPEAARSAPRGDICLVFCSRCGYIFNFCFDPRGARHAPRYDDPLFSSPGFQEHVSRLARRLVQRYQLQDKDAIEIGSGRGEFLALLCKLGGNRGMGFDPEYAPAAGQLSVGVTLIQDYFSERYAHCRADIICCRHLLERVPRPVDFLALVRRVIGTRCTTAVFFEVSNVLFTLRRLAVWDLFYERCSYFSPRSLVYLFSQTGFKLLALEETFDGRFLAVEAMPESNGVDLHDDSAEEYDRLVDGLEALAGQCWQKLAIWRQRLDRMAARKQRVVVWGSGWQTAAFLNALQIELRAIRYVVDDNPANQGKYLGGTGQELVSQAFLSKYRPQTIITLNGRQRQSIRDQTRALGFSPLIMVA